MKLQQKPQTMEAVLWTGATFSEWPEWIKEALLKKPNVKGRLFINASGDLCMTMETAVVNVEAGKYLVYFNQLMYIDTFENLSMCYNRLNSSGRPVELRQIDACDVALRADDALADDNDIDSPFTTGKGSSSKPRR